MSNDNDQYTEFSINVNNQTLHDLESELEQFRYQWKRELLEQRDNDEADGQSKLDRNSQKNTINEKKAAYLFNKAEILEQQSRHYEGIIIT